MYQEELTYKIRGAVFEVYRQLGGRFFREYLSKGANVRTRSPRFENKPREATCYVLQRSASR